MNIHEAFSRHRRDLKGKPFLLQDGSNRSGVITSVRGLFFPRTEEKDGLPKGPFIKVKFNEGKSLSEEQEINGSTLDWVNVP